MTDNEIIKALEICYQSGRDCEDCPYENIGNCYTNLKIDALDLIKRQQKYIDKSVKNLKWWLDTNTEKGVVYIPEFVIENIVKGCDSDDR